MRKQKKTKRNSYKRNLQISFILFVILVIGYMMFVTLYIDPKWDARMEKELIPVEQIIEEGNQKDEGYRREREKEKKEGEKYRCPDNYGEMIGGETHE